MNSQYEHLLALQIRSHGLPAPERQYRFAADLGRDYRLDFAWPDRRLCVEVDGGRFVGRGGWGQGVGRTSIPVAQHQGDADYRKRNLLQLLGWTVMAYPGELVKSGEAINEVALALERHPLPPPAVQPVWQARLRRHVQATLERDRLDRARREAKADARKRKAANRAQLLQEIAARKSRTSTAPDSRTTPATAPLPAASDAPPDE